MLASASAYSFLPPHSFNLAFRQSPPRFKISCSSPNQNLTADFAQRPRTSTFHRLFHSQSLESYGASLPQYMLLNFSDKRHKDCPRALFTSSDGASCSESQSHLSNMSQAIMPNLGQCFNSAGIAFALKVIFKEPRVALPHISVPDIRWIDWKALKESGFEGVVFDKDNTLTVPYMKTVCPYLSTSLEECKTAFEGRVALLSNSAGLHQYDPDGREANVVEDNLGVPVIRHGSKKPAGSAEELENYFGCDATCLVMVGDRHFTDIVYGNKNGLLTIFTKPLTLVGEPFGIRQVRTLEALFVQNLYQKGLLPVQHKLLSQDCNFVKDPSCP